VTPGLAKLGKQPRIQAELRLLGLTIAESTVAKDMTAPSRPHRGQRWHTFLRNHARQIVACDLLVVPTLTFRLQFVFVVLDHERRRILHIGVTTNPTVAWLAAQIRTAFVRTEDRPRFLLCDRDGTYGIIFDETVESMGIRTLRTTPRSPWQNAYVERVIGSIRRECLNHVIVLSQAGLRSILAEYVVYYNAGRAHQGLAGERPISRPRRTHGRVVARPMLGGLHHVYYRAA
jgi:putative transposase